MHFRGGNEIQNSLCKSQAQIADSLICALKAVPLWFCAADGGKPTEIKRLITRIGKFEILY